MVLCMQKVLFLFINWAHHFIIAKFLIPQVLCCCSIQSLPLWWGSCCMWFWHGAWLARIMFQSVSEPFHSFDCACIDFKNWGWTKMCPYLHHLPRTCGFVEDIQMRMNNIPSRPDWSVRSIVWNDFLFWTVWIVVFLVLKIVFYSVPNDMYSAMCGKCGLCIFIASHNSLTNCNCEKAYYLVLITVPL